MPLEPQIRVQLRGNTPQYRTCTVCGQSLPTSMFAPIHSPLYPSGRAPICNKCATADLIAHSFSWDYIDLLCRSLDIPFLPKEVERVRAAAGDDAFWTTYTKIFADRDYESIGWDYYHKQFLELRDANLIEDELPLLHDRKIKELREKWGGNYDDDDLYYLEDLYNGLLLTQNVNGALQKDQAKKLCCLSFTIDEAIRSGAKDIDKYLSAYDRIVKIAEFTPKNAKNVNDFDSTGEILVWLEKRGFANNFYDGATRDVIDETLKNMENWTQRLYINEGGIGDEISERIEQLKASERHEENYFDLDSSFDFDQYNAEVFKENEQDTFSAAPEEP